MSEVRFVVREADRDWSGTVHGSRADAAIAALAADPTTLAELDAALARFEKSDPRWPLSKALRSGLNDEPHDAGLVLIDLGERSLRRSGLFMPSKPSLFSLRHDVAVLEPEAAMAGAGRRRH